MKRLFAFLLILTCFRSQAATVWWALTNWNLTTLTNQSRVQLVGDTVQADGSYLVAGPAKFIKTSNGFFTNSFFKGNYQLDIQGVTINTPTPRQPVIFAVPDDPGGTYALGDLLISGYNTYHYTPGVQRLVAGVGISITPTNGIGPVTITASAGQPFGYKTNQFTTNQPGNAIAGVILSGTFSGDLTASFNYNATNLHGLLTSNQLSSPDFTNLVKAIAPAASQAITNNDARHVNMENDFTIGGYFGSAVFSNSGAFKLGNSGFVGDDNGVIQNLQAQGASFDGTVSMSALGAALGAFVGSDNDGNLYSIRDGRSLTNLNAIVKTNGHGTNITLHGVTTMTNLSIGQTTLDPSHFNFFNGAIIYSVANSDGLVVGANINSAGDLGVAGHSSLGDAPGQLTYAAGPFIITNTTLGVSNVGYTTLGTNGDIKMKDGAGVTTFLGHGYLSNTAAGLLISPSGAGTLTTLNLSQGGGVGLTVAGQTSLGDNVEAAANLLVDGTTRFGDLGSQVANVDPYGNATVSNLTVKGSFNPISVGIKTSTNYAIISVTGSGVSGVNGNYLQKITNSAGSGSATWTNAANTNFTLEYNDGDLGVTPAWSFQNKPSGKFYYDNFQTISPFGSYEDTGDGTAPMPVVTSKYTYTTNSVTRSLAASTNNIIYVDAAAGNDDTAVRGAYDRPYKDLINATLASHDGDQFFLAPGIYDNGFRMWNPTNASVIAPGATIISRVAASSAAVLWPYGAFTMIGGTLTNALDVTPYDPLTISANTVNINSCSNIVMNAVIVYGRLSSAIAGSAVGTWRGSLMGCKLYSTHDGINVNGLAGQNQCFSISGCVIECENKNDAHSRGVDFLLRATSFGALPARIAGCVIRTINGTNDTSNAINPTCGVEISDNDSDVQISGTVIDCTSTNPGPHSIYKVVHSFSGSVKVSGVAYNPQDTLGPITYEGGGFTTNFSFLVPGTGGYVTNTLYITNGIAMRRSSP